MQLELVQVDQKSWERHAPRAHQAVFGETLPPDLYRIDYALLVVDKEAMRPVGYVTAREHDKESVYLNRGGAFPADRGTVFTRLGYQKILDWFLARYVRITMLVENTNRAYLKLALAAGFLITGLRVFKQMILVEMSLEKGA